MRSRKLLFLIAAALGLLLLGALVVLPRLGQAAAPANTPGPTPTDDPAPLEAAPALGPPDAAITIVEYGDFGCSTCRYWHKQGVLSQLRARYGDRIRFVWRDFPVITPLSPKAAEAGQCAHEQGKFWEFHDLVYEHGAEIEASDLQADAAEIGLDMQQFEQCVSSRRYQERVNAEQHEGFERGFRATPAFLVNGKRVVGAQSLDFFTGLIDPLLAPGN